MELEERLRLSYYREIAAVNSAHGVKLVQHTETGSVFVMKSLRVYNRPVYELLQAESPAGVPHIQELIEADGTLYVVEEYISGKSLRELLEERGPFSESEAIALMDPLCDILQYLHRQTPPIVHRDIKPENILMDERGNLFLVDFNTAKECDAEQSRDTVLIGTAGYAAPEQYGFGASTPAADIYALGVLLRVLLTGETEKKIPLGKRLEAIVRQCTQLDPSDRFASVTDLQNTLHGRTKINAIRKWLPPGLRSNKPWIVALSALWYGLICLMASSIELEDATPTILWVNRFCCFTLFFSETLWLGNYRNVWRYVPLCRNKSWWVRILGAVLWGAVLFCGIMTVCNKYG